MTETVNLPVAGQTKKTYVYVGLAGVAGVVGYAYWRSRSGATTATPVVDTSTPVDTTPQGQTTPGLAYTPPQTPVSDVPTTAAQWVALALTELEAEGTDRSYASGILGRYLDHQNLTMAEADIVRRGWAIAGRFDFLPPIVTTGTGTPGTGTVPAPSGLHRTTLTKNSVTLVWNGPANANSYKVYRTGPGVSDSYPVNPPNMTWIGLNPNTSYTFAVTALTADGSESAKTGALGVHTPAK
jgi:hypothetical protein